MLRTSTREMYNMVLASSWHTWGIFYYRCCWLLVMLQVTGGHSSQTRDLSSQTRDWTLNPSTGSTYPLDHEGSPYFHLFLKNTIIALFSVKGKGKNYLEYCILDCKFMLLKCRRFQFLPDTIFFYSISRRFLWQALKTLYNKKK